MADQTVNPPSTEAVPNAIDRMRKHVAEVGGRVWLEWALEQARAEGRQQAVREIRAEAGLDEGWEFRPHGLTDGATINPFDLDAILDRVAGRVGAASESGQPPEPSS